jgi:hypothetical protein
VVKTANKKTGGTSYEPVFRIIGWVDRPEVFPSVHAIDTALIDDEEREPFEGCEDDPPEPPPPEVGDPGYEDEPATVKAAGARDDDSIPF